MNYEKSILYNPKIIYCVATVFSNFGSSLSCFVSVIYIARTGKYVDSRNKFDMMIGYQWIAMFGKSNWYMDYWNRDESLFRTNNDHRDVLFTTICCFL